MIAASELRIGNWVNIPNDVQCFITFIGQYRCHLKTDKAILPKLLIGESVANEDISPIPLTPEILEKCGLYYCTEGTCSERYKYQEGYWVLITSTIYLKDGGDGFSVETITYSHEESTEIAVIKYLHQLQNLYFALTNQELTYDSTQ